MGPAVFIHYGKVVEGPVRCRQVIDFVAPGLTLPAADAEGVVEQDTATVRIPAEVFVGGRGGRLTDGCAQTGCPQPPKEFSLKWT